MSDWSKACPACGTETVPGASFCYRCGVALEAGGFDRPGADPGEAAGSESPQAEGFRPPEAIGSAAAEREGGAEPLHREAMESSEWLHGSGGSGSDAGRGSGSE